MSDVENIDHGLEGGKLLAALEERAALIMSQIASSNDPSQLRSLANEARMLITQIPQGSTRAGTTRALIDAAVQSGEQRASEAEGDEGSQALSGGGGGPRSLGSSAFQSQMLQLMSSQERQFMNSLEDNKQYKMASIDKDGNVTETGKSVEGAQLKEDFARVKYHSLTEEQQAGVTLPDGTKATHMTPEQENKELDKLNKSLDDLEGYKAHKLMEQGASRDECKECHRHFDKAREQVHGIQDRIRRRQELRENGKDTEANMENAMIQVDKGRLRKTLKDEVIDDALLGEGKQGSEMKISAASPADHGLKVANISRNDGPSGEQRYV